MALVRWTLAVVLCAATAQAQTRDENMSRCKGTDPDLAIAACTALIDSGRENDGDLADAWDSRGKAYVAKGELQRSIYHFSQAILLSPMHPTAFVNRGTVYFRMGVYDQALQDTRSALRVSLKDVDAYRLRGMALARTHQHELAIQNYDRVLGLKDSAEIRALRCESLKVMKREKEC